MKKSILHNNCIKKQLILPLLPVAEEMVKLQNTYLSYPLWDYGDWHKPQHFSAEPSWNPEIKKHTKPYISNTNKSNRFYLISYILNNKHFLLKIITLYKHFFLKKRNIILFNKHVQSHKSILNKGGEKSHIIW